MTARYELLHLIGSDDAEAQAAVDRYRAEVLAEAADFVGNDDTCGCGGCDTCVPNKLAAGLRAMADASRRTA